MMELEDAIHGRRSIRSFSGMAVSDAAVAWIIDAARWAPSACNLQAWEFVVVRERAAKKRLADAGAVAFIREAPIAIYVLYRSDATSENHANIQSAAAAVQNMLLMAHSLGLGSVWVCQCGDRDEVRKILGIPREYEIPCAVLVGHPKGRPSPPRRREVAELMHRERFGGGKGVRRIFPGEWEPADIEAYREKGIRATSPAKDSFPPRFPAEFSMETAAISGQMEHATEVLDILSFSGTHLLEICRLAGIRKASVYETSPQIAEFIRKKASASGAAVELSFGISGIGSLPFASGRFGAVLCIKKLEMLPDPAAMLKEISRVLGPGGKLILSFWNSFGIHGLNYRLKTGLAGDTRVSSNEGPVKPMAIGKARALVRSCGLRINKELGINLGPRMESFVSEGPMRHFCRTVILSCSKD